MTDNTADVDDSVDRNYFRIEIVKRGQLDEPDSLVESHRVETPEAVGERIAELDRQDKLQCPNELVVTKMTRLDAPLTEEEEEQLEEWIDQLQEEAEPGNCPDCGSSQTQFTDDYELYCGDCGNTVDREIDCEMM